MKIKRKTCEILQTGGRNYRMHQLTYLYPVRVNNHCTSTINQMYHVFPIYENIQTDKETHRKNDNRTERQMDIGSRAKKYWI